MKQMLLVAARGFEKHNRATRKAEFLARIESLMHPRQSRENSYVGLDRALRSQCSHQRSIHAPVGENGLRVLVGS